MRLTRALPAALAAALLVPAAAHAATSYPPPREPGKVTPRPTGKHRTLCVERKAGRGCFARIQDAVDAAKAGDTIKVARGVWREGVQIKGPGKSYLRLIGDPKRPGRVVLDGTGLKRSDIAAQNGVKIEGADGVTVNGFTARNFLANGFFAVNVNGYTLTNLIAARTGAYGVYAFNSVGGTMSRSEAYYNNDSGFYIGQTPKQTRPKRSIVTHVRAWGNVLGFSGTNMRYVTITKSEWFNNGLGIVPNALLSELYAPPEDNVIVDNDIFWNNFDYYAAAPFKLGASATGTPYPVGVGILLFGSQGTRVERNRIYGNYLVGYGALEQLLLKGDVADEKKRAKAKADADAYELQDNVVRGNAFGLGGKDLNGRDLFYDGSGRGNCFEGNALLSPTTPADGSTFTPCATPPAANALNSAAQLEAVNWAVGDATHEAFWLKHPHAAKPGIAALERCVVVKKSSCRGQRR